MSIEKSKLNNSGGNIEISLEKGKANFDDNLSKLRLQESDRETSGWVEAQKLRDEYKTKLVQWAIAEGKNLNELEMPGFLKAELDKKMEIVDEKYTVNGVHFLKCHFSKIIDDLRSGRRVEFEAFGPYLKDYLGEGFDVKDVKYMSADETGLAIMKFLRQIMPEAHPVSLYDEYNLGTAANESGTGLSTDPSKQKKGSERGQREAADIFKDRFKKFVEESMRAQEIIGVGETEGPDKDFVLISETEKIKDAEELVKILKALELEKGRKIIASGVDQEIWFQNNIDDCEDPRHLRIQLRDREGKWQCAALDASGFLNPINRDITHLVILSKPSEKNKENAKDEQDKVNNFEIQQDQVWEILRLLGFQPEHYHNIFFEIDDKYDSQNNTFNPGLIVDTIRSQVGVLLSK